MGGPRKLDKEYYKSNKTYSRPKITKSTESSAEILATKAAMAFPSFYHYAPKTANRLLKLSLLRHIDDYYNI